MNKIFALLFVTGFWFIFAVAGYILAFRCKERGIIQCCVILTAVCCWLIWLVTFLMQMNPLIGPRVDQRVIYSMASYWENSYVRPI